MLKAGGDKKVAIAMLPSFIKRLIEIARTKVGSLNETLSSLGNFSGMIFQELNPAYPMGFAAWALKENSTIGSSMYGKFAALNRTSYSISEMQALYDVIASPVALGTTASSSVKSKCEANVTVSGCGYLFYLTAFEERTKAGFNPETDQLLKSLNANIQHLFCPSPEKCLTIDPFTSQAIAAYITSHLTKIALHIGLDGGNFGPIVSQTVKQLAHGFVDKRLQIDGLSTGGLKVIGVLPNESVFDLDTRHTQSFYTCANTEMAHQWAGKSEIYHFYCILCLGGAYSTLDLSSCDRDGQWLDHSTLFQNTFKPVT